MNILNRTLEINDTGALVNVYRVATVDELPTGVDGERAVVGGVNYRNYAGTWAIYTGAIDTTAGDAIAANITKDKTAYVDGELITGTFDFAAETAGTAVAGDIATGKTAWVDGVEITGTAT